MHIRNLGEDMGVEQAKKMFDMSENGKGDVALEIVLANFPAIRGMSFYAAEKLKDIITDLELNQEQAAEFARMYLLGAATTAMLVYTAEEL